ncbi:MAG: hypothetical protein AAGD14_05020 [Planctomycetota bacterium]
MRFRLRADPARVVQAWVMEYGEQGMRVREMAADRSRRVSWDELLEGDRRLIRRRLKLELTELEKKGLVEGVRLRLKGGAHLDGLLIKIDADGAHWLLRGGSRLPYPKDRIESTEPVLVAEADVYPDDELYRLLVERWQPRTAERHRKLGEVLYGAGDFVHARKHYEEAVRLKPSWKWTLEPTLQRLRALARDKRLAAALRKSRKLSRLDHDFSGARALLQRHLHDGAGGSRLVLRALDEIDALEHDEQARVFHDKKRRAAHRLIDDFLRKKKPSHAEALAWARTDLAAAIRRRLMKQMGIDEATFSELAKNRPGGSAHWATYGTGSFIHDPFAKRGIAGRGEIAGDPESWWVQYTDVARRAAYLRAYAVEKNPELFEMVRAYYKPCSGCGGKGVKQHTAARSVRAIGGRHEWWQACPRCFKCGRDRVVAYR